MFYSAKSFEKPHRLVTFPYCPHWNSLRTVSEPQILHLECISTLCFNKPVREIQNGVLKTLFLQM